jgi:hypothetical protein
MHAYTLTSGSGSPSYIIDQKAPSFSKMKRGKHTNYQRELVNIQDSTLTQGNHGRWPFVITGEWAPLYCFPSSNFDSLLAWFLCINAQHTPSGSQTIKTPSECVEKTPG